MKRCPRCYETYDGSEKFCELDGQPLLADPAISMPAASNAGLSEMSLPKAEVSQSAQQREVWFVGTAGVVLGIVVCVAGYLAFGLWNDDSGFKDPSAPAFAAQTRDSIPASRPQPPRSEPILAPEETATLEPEASPEPSPVPTEESNAVAAPLNPGPVSTGQRKKDTDEKVQTIIQMNDGTSVEVDAAWEDGQGVWYRRGGMVAFVESQRVKAITGRAAQKPSSGSTQ
jgi:hypothetical protein